MSVCGSLHHIFENPLTENPTLLESLTWSQIKPLKSVDSSSSSTFTEIFGELHFKESPLPSPSPSSSSNSPPICTSSFSEINHTGFSQKGVVSSNDNTPVTTNNKNGHKSSESLQLCTEGLGFESSDDVEDLKTCGERELLGSKKFASSESSEEGDNSGEWRTGTRSMRLNNVEGSCCEYPPPISCIGRRSGKPCVSFKSYRRNGRFVLKEIRIPTQELLHAHREDGRLKLHFVHPDEEELLEEEDDQDEDYDVDVHGVDEGEDNMGKENDGMVIDQVREEKEIGA